MRRILLAALAAALFASPVPAGAPAPPRTLAARFAASPVVVVGKVTAIEKETVDAAAYPGAKEKIAHKIAVVKISDNLGGADNLTHIKIGFIPPPKVDPTSSRPIRPAAYALELTEGKEVLLFLSKHPGAEFYIMSWMSPSIDLGTLQGKNDLETAKKFAAVLADPLKGLKSEKKDVRAETATLLAIKYRTAIEGAGNFEEIAIPAEESKLILKGLADGSWKQDGNGSEPSAIQAFFQLGLTEKDGWKPLMAEAGKDIFEQHHEAFFKWLDGPGKEYRIKKLVPKKEK